MDCWIIGYWIDVVVDSKAFSQQSINPPIHHLNLQFPVFNSTTSCGAASFMPAGLTRV
jgi:hypothetical protein